MNTPRKSRDVAKSPLTSGPEIDTFDGCYMDRTLPVRTLEECALKLGITKQRAHQLEQSAFRKIRAALAAMEHAA